MPLVYTRHDTPFALETELAALWRAMDLATNGEISGAPRVVELGGAASSGHTHAAADIVSGTLANARIAARLKGREIEVSIQTPDVTSPDEFVAAGGGYAQTLTEVYAYCIGGTSVDFNLYIRDRDDAQVSAGQVKVFTADAQATTTAAVKLMDNTAVGVDKIVKLELTAKVGSPTWLYVFIRIKVND